MRPSPGVVSDSGVSFGSLLLLLFLNCVDQLQEKAGSVVGSRIDRQFVRLRLSLAELVAIDEWCFRHFSP